MYKPLFAISTLLSGTGAMSAVLFMSTGVPAADDALAKQPGRAAADVVAVARRPSPTATVARQFIQLDEMKVVATDQKPRRRPSVASLKPCSEWKELGPRYLSSGDEVAFRSVRELCR